MTQMVINWYVFFKLSSTLLSGIFLQIEIDFGSLYPEKTNSLLLNYDHFVTKILVYYAAEIKDKQSKDLLLLASSENIEKSKWN